MSGGMTAMAVSYLSREPAGKIQGEGLVLGRGHAQQAGIQFLQVVHRGVDAFGYQAQVHGIVDGDLVYLRRGLRRTRCQPILLRDSWP